MFHSRHIEPEVLDHAAPEVARENLADLVRINRSFGGHSTIRKLLRQVVRPSDSFTILDVGAASGDTARVIREAYPNAQVISLDYNRVNIEKAPAPKVIADAFHRSRRTASTLFLVRCFCITSRTKQFVTCSRAFTVSPGKRF